MMEATSTRKAKLPDGSLATWHLFFVDRNHDPLALVEMAGGVVRTVPAGWVEFLPEEENPHLKNEIMEISRSRVKHLR